MKRSVFLIARIGDGIFRRLRGDRVSIGSGDRLASEVAYCTFSSVAVAFHTSCSAVFVIERRILRHFSAWREFRGNFRQGGGHEERRFYMNAGAIEK